MTSAARRPQTREPRGVAVSEAPAEISDAQFALICDFARRRMGVTIADHKRSMVLRRIRRRMDALDIATVSEYCELLRNRGAAAELQPLINALTTNKTAFFRERHHFDHLGNVALPALSAALAFAKIARPLRLWSAGCSTGEEAWSIAMIAAAAVQQQCASEARILATDIDTDVLATARDGRYPIRDFDEVPRGLAQQYFERDAMQPHRLRAGQALRGAVTFKALNLHDAWPFSKPFDVIFCRNVVIYFDRAAQATLYNRFANALRPNGFLYCGHSEMLHGVSRRFESVGRSVYRRIA